MFGKRYSRLKFWIISVCLFIPDSILITFAKAYEKVENNDTSLILYLLIMVISVLWINTLANRIRDYGSNPWISLFALIPLVNILLGFYYGLIKYKKNTEKINNNKETNSHINSLPKAVVNHAKDIANEIKPTVNNYVQKHNSSRKKVDNIEFIDEDEIYEKIMIEIEKDQKVKSTWAKSLAQSDGDNDKSNSIYINLRFNQLLKETQKINENLQSSLKEENLNKNIDKSTDKETNINNQNKTHLTQKEFQAQFDYLKDYNERKNLPSSVDEVIDELNKKFYVDDY